MRTRALIYSHLQRFFEEVQLSLSELALKDITLVQGKKAPYYSVSI
jgi:hypothetical protein